MCQKSSISHKTANKLSKIRENPKCDKNVSKNLQKYIKNMSKYKMYLNSVKTRFKNVTKKYQIFGICYIFDTFWLRNKYIERKHLDIKCNKKVTNPAFWYFFDTLFPCFGNICETFWIWKSDKKLSKLYFWQIFVTILSCKGHSL